MSEPRNPWDVVIVGGGIAGLSAAIYLGRARRQVLVVDRGLSLALHVPDVENYLGFPEGLSGQDLLSRGREQADRFGARFVEDTISEARPCDEGLFLLSGDPGRTYHCRRILLATGIWHVPPDLPGVADCIGNSLFFCKDCDGRRCEGKRVGIFGWNREAADYALGMLVHTDRVAIFCNGHERGWSESQEQWLRQYEIPVFDEGVAVMTHDRGQVTAVKFEGGGEFGVDALFTTRGDAYHNKLAHQLGAGTSGDGEVTVDPDRQTTVKGVYAAGCVTPSNCQMIIAAGDGAAAAQAINRSLFDESLETGALPRRTAG